MYILRLPHKDDHQAVSLHCDIDQIHCAIVQESKAKQILVASYDSMEILRTYSIEPFGLHREANSLLKYNAIQENR